MGRLAARTTEWLMRRRASLPAWMNDAMASVARNPDGVLGRLAGRLLRTADPAPTTVPDAQIRLYISPTNYSGQGYAWARAVERADPAISARNVEVVLPGSFGFAADTHVAIATVNSSTEWAAAEWAAAAQFTHVLVEAERSMFGRQFGRDLRREIAALEASGVSVAYISHGTDIRDPAAHAQRTPWSPYPEDPRTDVLHADAVENLALMSTLRRPTFVSTPDLIDDVPWAVWCPVVIAPEVFRAETTPFSGGPVRIVHVSSSPVQKGSHLIEPALAPLIESGAVEYRLVTGAPAAEMPAIFASADIVIDQFRIGSYGVAACEAMAAGRVVIGHVLPAVRDRVEETHGIPLPIVEATPDTLRSVISSIVDDPTSARASAAAGPAFVSRVHDGTASSRALIEGWIRASA